MTIEQIAHRIREEHAKYAHKEGMDWTTLAAAKIKAEMMPAKRLTDNDVAEEIIKYDELLNQNTEIPVDVRLQMGTAFGAGMRHARDNGYLGGLTVEEVEEAFFGNLYVIGNEGAYIEGVEEFYDDLRARLTAKLKDR